MAPSSGETGQKAFSPLSASQRWLPAYPGEAPHRTRSAGNLALAYQSPELRKIRPLSHPILDNLLQPPDRLRQPGEGSPEACPSASGAGGVQTTSPASLLPAVPEPSPQALDTRLPASLSSLTLLLSWGSRVHTRSRVHTCPAFQD